MRIYKINRGFNLRAFENGKPFAAIPDIFQEHAQFIEDLSKVKKKKKEREKISAYTF